MVRAPKAAGERHVCAPLPMESGSGTVQRKLHTRSGMNRLPLPQAVGSGHRPPQPADKRSPRVEGDRGRRTTWSDGSRSPSGWKGVGVTFVAELRSECALGIFRAVAARRVLIPKPGHPGSIAPSGIAGREGQGCAGRAEARPGADLRGGLLPDLARLSAGQVCAWGAGASSRGSCVPENVVRPKPVERPLPYQWAIEGDIPADASTTSAITSLMEQVQAAASVTQRSTGLLVAFLKAGVLDGGTFFRTDIGTPQGGILSPLLANVALSALEERYAASRVGPRRALDQTGAGPDEIHEAERSEHARRRPTRGAHPVLVPVRYADDFLILVAARTRPAAAC